MLIRATSDLHGVLPIIDPCDMLIIAGDICPAYASHAPAFQRDFLIEEFQPWLRDLPVDNIVLVAGNHDFVFEVPSLVPDLSCVYLENSDAEVAGLKVWGTPWTPHFFNWAFNAPDDPGEFGAGEAYLRWIYSKAPDDTDIIVTHGPPRGFGDKNRGGIRCGSYALREAIERVQPKLVICGHIHEAKGHYRYGTTRIYNVSFVNDAYKPDTDGVVEIRLAEGEDRGRHRASGNAT